MYQLAILALSLLSPMAASYRPLDTVESAAVMDKVDRKRSTSRPIIGILTQPGDLAGEGESYFSAGYVKWLESAGARVVPILFDLEMHELDKMFSMVNGILIPGGNYDLSTETTWFKAAEHLFKLVKAANDKGDRVVMHGTCLGFELLVTLLTRTGDALVKLDAYNHPAPITFSPHSIDSSWVRQIPQDVQANLETHPISMHNHHYGFLPQTWDDYSNLRDFFMPVAHSYDRQDVRYISMIEAYDYPITGIAFHPEKVPFEWTTEIDIPHSRMANDAAYALAQAFVSQARKNNHEGKDIVQEDTYSINNFKPHFYGKHNSSDQQLSFEQVYIFNIEEWHSIVDRL